jgi:hypothetical protein
MIPFLSVALFTLLSNSNAKAEELIQYIDCHFANPASTDHVVVSLESSLSGSFYYTTGIDDQGNDQNTGRLALHQVESPASSSTDALFLAQFMTVQDGSKITINFNFSMPKDLLFKSSDFFNARLTTDIIDKNQWTHTNLTTDDELTCFARLYPKNLL